MVGLVVALGVVACPLATPQGRDLGVEVRYLALSYPLALIALAVHVKRRRPDLWGKALRIFLFVFLTRLALLCLVTDHSARTIPEYGGHSGRDGVTYASYCKALSIAMGLSIDPDKYYDSAIAQRNNYLFFDPAELARSYNGNSLFWTLLKWPFIVPFAFLTLLLGQSVVALVMIICLFGAFAAVQAWLYGLRFFHADTAAVVALWVAVAPTWVAETLWFHKNIIGSVFFMYYFEGLQERLVVNSMSRPWWRWALSMAMVIGVSIVSRPFYPILLTFGLVYGWVRQRLVQPSHRAVLDLASVVILVLRSSGSASALDRYLGGFGSTWLTPGPSLLLAPDLNWFGVSVALQGLLWPFVVAAFTGGLVLHLRGRLRISPIAVILVFWNSALIATVAGLNWNGSVKRLVVEPIILVLAVELRHGLALESPAMRRVIAAICVAAGTAALLFHALIALVFYTN